MSAVAGEVRRQECPAHEKTPGLMRGPGSQEYKATTMLKRDGGASNAQPQLDIPNRQPTGLIVAEPSDFSQGAFDPQA